MQKKGIESAQGKGETSPIYGKVREELTEKKRTS